MPSLSILGAGIAGLAASAEAVKLGLSPHVYEAGPRPAGLLDSIEVDGFRFDHAVHLSFAEAPEARGYFDQTKYQTHGSSSRCTDDGLWFKHPVQNNLYPLPVDEKVRLIAGFVNRPNLEVYSYEDWLIYQYGQAIAEKYPIRYTQKYWRTPASSLGVDWIGPRMHRTELPELLRGALTDETPNVYYAKEMRYPLQGGYRAFLGPLLASADISLNHCVSRVDPVRRCVHFKHGAVLAYEHLLSTIPLPELVALTDGVPDDIRADSQRLVATSVDLVSIGFKRPDVPKDLWFYIYDDDLWAARAYAPSLKSADNAPPGRSSIQFEIYSSAQQPLHRSAAELIDNCVYALAKLGLAGADDICLTHHKHVRYANVIFDEGMEVRRDRVKAWLAGQQIHLAGRFGEWAYLWSHQAYQSGVDAVRRLAAAMPPRAA